MYIYVQNGFGAGQHYINIITHPYTIAAGKASSAHPGIGELLVDRTISEHTLLRVAGGKIATRRRSTDAADPGPD